jgi:anti-sigma regulatory factor (Ser/Thr protein kinase)
MMRPAFEPALLRSSDALRFDALHVPANRRSAEAAWYDVFALDDERYVVAVGNVAGAGARPADLMLAVRESFGAPNTPAEPAALLRAAEARLRHRYVTAEAFATATVGIVDRGAQTFTYVSAGHPPPYVRYHDGSVAVLPADGLPIGLNHCDHPSAQVVVDLRDAALLMLYSRMLVEASRDVEDGFTRLRTVLEDERMLHCTSPAAWVARHMLGDSLNAETALFVCMFGRSRPAPAGRHPHWTASWSFEATAGSSNGVRRAFLAALTSKTNGATTLDLAAAELIFGELLGNVVRHAPGPVDIVLDWTNELPVLHVFDNGPGFRSRRKRERLPQDDWSESGRGLFIVNACATEFEIVNREGRGTHARATLPPA